MFDFLNKEYKPWSKVSGQHYDNAFLEKKVVYNKDKYAIGFDYNSCLSGFEREYIYSVVKWMSLKVGKTRKMFDGFKTHQPCPYTVYDGCEIFPVYVVKPNEFFPLDQNLSQFFVDQFCLKLNNSQYLFSIIDQIIKLDDFEQLINSCNELIGLTLENPCNILDFRDRVSSSTLSSLDKLAEIISKNTNIIREEIKILDEKWNNLNLK